MHALLYRILTVVGIPVATFLVAVPVFAQVATTTFGSYSTSTTIITPGVPSTGVGGDYTTTLIVLALAALAVVIGATYLARSPRSPSDQ